MVDEFPAGVRRFIGDHIESLAQLEALLLLRGDPQRQWEVADIAKALYIPEDMASSLLADFARRGVATLVPSTEGCYKYQSLGDESDRLIDQLASVYRERRVAVISLIYSKPLNKVQTFADAFRLRKEEPQ